MKKIVKITSLILLIMFMFVLPFINVNEQKTINASSNLQVMKNSSGNDMTYRNSSEKVYGLAEYDYPTAEYRAAWVSTFVSDIPAYTTAEKFKSDATYILDDLVSMGMNAIVFHVRTHNNALYNSDLNPIATWWQKVDFDKFDPLTWFIDECHKRGLEFHAWMNPYRITDGYVAEPYPEGHPCNDPTQVLTSSSGAKILDPGSTKVQDFIVDTCMEFLDRYDADAIHFDDYFYIRGVASDVDADQKRANVDAFIKKLSDEMKEMNTKEGRAVQLGISPSGIYRNGSYASSPKYDSNGNLTSPIYSNTSGFAHYDDYLYSDTKKWIDNEWIDYITPQTYWGMEHTGANFYELSRWWSWAVKYKKVNLYLGIGIYMADGTGTSANYWKKNQNEIKNQILNSGQYDEVKGLCYYKYSYLHSDNTIISNGVNLIKNDYYKKRIPGAVIQRYANSLPSVEATNLVLSGNSLSWDLIDNVFGYMVYQVPKGETLDINNIDHVYQYTQNTSVTGVDTLKYDYYVSSVNRVNVKSNPVKYGGVELSGAELVVALINALPANITLDDATAIQNIRTKYNALSENDKNAVSNYQILVNAEELINKLGLLKTKADNFIATVDTKINKNRILPIGENMKWSYVNVSDANKYNITTGIRLQNYIAPEIIELYLEVTDGNLTYKQKVEFDLCFLETGLTGLYYRNDASAMSEVHVGAHTGATSFIGWSNATVTIGSQVLFVAKNNYHELTSSTIPSCNWTSCAGVYTNKSSSNVTMTLSQAFSTESPTYGYIVIGANNQIKVSSQESPGTASVTLAPNESLLIIRYLDRMINNTPFTNFDMLKVGTYAKVAVYSDEEIPVIKEYEKVITLINTLPSNITLNDESLVNEIKAEFDKLSAEDQAQVTNKEILTNAISKITELKQALEQARNNAIKEIDSYVVLNNYSETNQATIKGYITTFKNSVAKASDEASINKLVIETKGYIDQVKTLAQELEEYKQAQIKKLESSVDKSLYSETNQSLITQYINNAKDSISKATTIIEVDEAVLLATSEINKLPTYEAELASYRTNKYDELFAYAGLNSYSSKNQETIDYILYDFSVAVETLKSYADIDVLFDTAKAEIDKVPTKAEELAQAKLDTIASINSYINIDDYSGELKESLQTLLTNTINDINNELNINKLPGYITTFKNSVNLLIISDYANNEATKALANIDLTKYSVENQALIKSKIETISQNISSSTTKEQIDEKVKTVLLEIASIKTLEQTLNEYKEQVINNINNYVDLTNASAELKQEVEQIINNAQTSINASTTEEAVNTIRDNTFEAINIAKVKDYARKEAKKVEESIDFTKYSTENQALINEHIASITKDITKDVKETTIDERVKSVNNEISQILTTEQELAQQLASLKQEVSTYLNGLLNNNLSTAKKELIQQLVTTKLAELDTLTTVEEVETLKEQAQNEYDKIAAENEEDVLPVEPDKDPAEEKGCGCGSSASLVIFLSIMLSTLVVLIRKKH